jgi:hypothetical protein
MFSQGDNENRRSVRFAEHVDPDSTVTLTKQIEEDATVEQLTVRVYRGAELALQVYPFVKREGRRFPLIDFNGKSFVDGEGDKWQFDVSESVETDDLVGVEVTNTATDYGYDFSTDVSLDRAGGSSRVVSFLKGLI